MQPGHEANNFGHRYLHEWEARLMYEARCMAPPDFRCPGGVVIGSPPSAPTHFLRPKKEPGPVVSNARVKKKPGTPASFTRVKKEPGSFTRVKKEHGVPAPPSLKKARASLMRPPTSSSTRPR
jgi:hypothetical protein